MKRKLDVDLDELDIAFHTASYRLHHYLDLETGEVILIMDEFAQELEAIYEEIHDQEGKGTVSLEAYLEERVAHDWQKEMLLAADRVEQEYGTRYIRVEREDPHADYEDMERFIDGLHDSRLQKRLWRAIQGRGAFRYFTDVLSDHPDVRQQWFQFRDARRRRRARLWLEARGIEPVS